jgi:outer membrane protein assembly factor BamB
MADSGTEWTRRGTLRTIGGSLVGGALVSGTADVATGQTGESWPQFRYDDSRTGNAPGNVGPVADVSPEWVFETSENLGEDGAEWSSPAVVDGTLYVGRKVDDTVYAVDVDDGTEEWRFVTNDGVTSSPAVADGTVYIGSSDDSVYALDAADGEEQWQYLSESASGPDDIDSSPTVVDGTVYVGSSNGRVYALDADTGREHWTFETGA